MAALTALLVATTLAPHLVADVELRCMPDELQAHFESRSRRVHLTAEAQIKVEADRALVTLKVSSKDKKLSKALVGNQRLRGELLRHLESNGIPNERVKISRYSSMPRPGLFGKTGSYTVQNIVVVTIEDEHQYQAVAEFIDERHEVAYESMRFKHSNETQLKLDVVNRACQRLIEKKVAFEQGLDVKLTLSSFSQLPQQSHQHHKYPRSSAGSSSIGRVSDAIQRRMEAQVVDAPSVFSSMTFSHQITGEFEVASE